MKRGKILATLTLAFTLGIGATAFAANETSINKTTTTTSSETNKSTASNTTGIGLRRITGKRGYDYALSIAKDMLKMDDAAIDKARDSNKTIYDLLEENGVSHDEFKAKLIQSKEQAIDKAVESGDITKEEATNYKNAVKNNAANSVKGQGNLNKAKGNGNNAGQGKGYKNNGSNCSLNN